MSGRRILGFRTNALVWDPGVELTVDAVNDRKANYESTTLSACETSTETTRYHTGCTRYHVLEPHTRPRPVPGTIAFDLAISAVIDHLMVIEDHQLAIEDHQLAIAAHLQVIDGTFHAVKALVEEVLP